MFEKTVKTLNKRKTKVKYVSYIRYNVGVLDYQIIFVKF